MTKQGALSLASKGQRLQLCRPPSWRQLFAKPKGRPSALLVSNCMTRGHTNIISAPAAPAPRPQHPLGWRSRRLRPFSRPASQLAVTTCDRNSCKSGGATSALAGRPTIRQASSPAALICWRRPARGNANPATICLTVSEAKSRPSGHSAASWPQMLAQTLCPTRMRFAARRQLASSASQLCLQQT